MAQFNNISLLLCCSIRPDCYATRFFKVHTTNVNPTIGTLPRWQVGDDELLNTTLCFTPVESQLIITGQMLAALAYVILV